jgi:hypothetical protein
MDQRVPTFLFSIDDVPSPEASVQLAGAATASGRTTRTTRSSCTPRLSLRGGVAAGVIHYNTEAEVDGVLAATRTSLCRRRRRAASRVMLGVPLDRGSSHPAVGPERTEAAIERLAQTAVRQRGG